MVSKGRKRDDAIRRRPPQREPKHRILIVCEGAETEPGYFRDYRNDVRNPRVHVEPVGAAGVPMTVVSRAIELRDLAAARARAERDDNLRWDEVWVVFDVDEHPRVEEAKLKAEAAGIECAVSNPCFELWALLHFTKQQAHIERDDVASKLRKYMPGYQKRLDYEAMKPGYPKAVDRARSLAEEANRFGEPGRNPTSGVYRLTENIRSK